ncbi:hypothetical protein NEMBOFW57_004944 [Staphylotrichum longicolle]|uniref:Amidohydrolase-related domain-containing protein n=1 Tax=Staphylotrichum longicolle TaxID=669026 RepID=A0AAD4EWF2_9PEZI|nr:hypothetical protein NEMBOFW57_004944 [Staphylotrichum longicolle]
MSSPTPPLIIDSHIHLYPSTELASLAWCHPTHPLHAQRSVAEFHAATGSPPNLAGFLFVETDRQPTAAAADFAGPLQEIAFMRRLATGDPRPGEGHTPADAKLCLGFVPWAPMTLGARGRRRLEGISRAGGWEETWSRVKGWRYLLQDKENGTGLGEGFIEGLKVLLRGFEVTDPSFIAWRTAMFTLSKCRKTYMKLSGCFSELPDKLRERPAEDIFAAILPWLAVVVAAFGPSRIMFGSDWPVCTVVVGEDAWKKWHKIVDMVCDLAGLSPEDQAMLWGGTAKEAYKLDC